MWRNLSKKISSTNHLEKFIVAQEQYFEIAFSEIQTGKKQTHWMWYIFPQIKGLGQSSMAKQYAIHNRREATEYISNPYLRDNLIKITKALLQHDDDIIHILGYPDNLKLKSCMTLFEMVAPEITEFAQVLDKFFEGKRDKFTNKIK